GWLHCTAGGGTGEERIPQPSSHRPMATTATGYGCSAALSFPGRGSSFAGRSPPSRACLTSSNPKLRTPAPSLRVSYLRRGLYVCACSGDVDPDASEEASFDIKLPRRSLLVQFTCNKCDARTKRLINRVGYERGTVFLQVNCSVCLFT
uniref:DNL-type domain-containing protein n=1 Tax=Aegilops tauschii subsp. strangulata TaxID=200361 RepID=A0A453F0J4_AEGTS